MIALALFYLVLAVPVMVLALTADRGMGSIDREIAQLQRITARAGEL